MEITQAGTAVCGRRSRSPNSALTFTLEARSTPSISSRCRKSAVTATNPGLPMRRFLHQGVINLQGASSSPSLIQRSNSTSLRSNTHPYTIVIILNVINRSSVLSLTASPTSFR